MSEVGVCVSVCVCVNKSDKKSVRYCKSFSADLSDLKYVTMCIKESMRLHCPVPFIQRETTSGITVDGVTLPLNSIVGANIYGLHHNPVVWDDPMVSQLLQHDNIILLQLLCSSLLMTCLCE